MLSYPLTDLDTCTNEDELYEVKLYNGEYYGYKIVNCEWVKKDIVEFKKPSSYPEDPDDDQYNIGKNSASVSILNGFCKDVEGVLVPCKYRVYSPCEWCYRWSIGDKKDISTNTLLGKFYWAFGNNLSGHQTERDQLFNSFVYGKGQPVIWKIGTPISEELLLDDQIENNINSMELEIINWVYSHGDLDGLIQSEKLKNALENIDFNTFFRLWAFQMFGGIQAQSVKIVKFKENNGFYECEFVYSITDNFGLNTNEKWHLPGITAQWVLQHSRNDYCCEKKAFHPVVYHEVEFHHSFSFPVN